MKDDRELIELVCRRWCRFYRDGAKEELTCAGYEFFRGRLEPDAVRGLAGAEDTIGHDPRIERALCARCGFRAEDCDFMAAAAPAGAVPCGGYELLARLLAAGRGKDCWMGQTDQYVRIAPGVVYRGLEVPHLFHRGRDELYELDADGLAFLAEADGTRRAEEIGNQELLTFAEAEGLIEYAGHPERRELARGLAPGLAPVPSLRYLEVILTRRCNLRCAHCYLGDAQGSDLDPGLARAVAGEFDEMQGLRLLLSGGEPLLYPHWDELAPALRGRGYRVVLLTNGQALDRERLLALPVDEVQVSLDGLAAGHEALRGRGTFARAVAAARLTRETGRDLSIATMIHAGNVEEMEGLEALVRELGAREWGLDVPAEAGRWARGPEGAKALLAQAAVAMASGFGGSYHGAGEGFACGRHLAAVLPDGWVVPCGFYPDDRLGPVSAGLRAAWRRKRQTPLAEIAGCGGCGAAADCAGGCRFRAEALGQGGPDPVMCAVHLDPREEIEDNRG